MKRWCLGLVVVGIAVLFVVILQDSALAQTGAAPDTSGVHIDGEYATGLSYLPTDVSEHGPEIDRLINVLHIFMILLFAGWGLFFLFCLVKFRQRPGHKAEPAPIKARVSKWAEIAVAGFEAFILVGLAMPVWGSVKNDIPTDDQNPLRLRVIAEQFQWNFHYAGADGKFGRTAPEFVDTATNAAGLDPDDPAGKDDVVTLEMHITDTRPVICDITSKDVIHSFFIPVMRIKQDAIPGMRIPVWFKAKDGTHGTYEIACAQLCGNNHYSMRALLVIETENEFESWLKEASIVEEFDEDDLD